MVIERQIVDTAARLRRQREPHLIATVVRVQGSAYRRPGARMLLTQFRWLTGSASGGCLEGDIAKQGWWATQSGEPVIVTFDSSIDEAAAADDDIRSAFGLGCDSVVEVLVERAGLPGRVDSLAFAAECLRTQKRGAIATVIRSRVAGAKVGQRVAVRVGGEPQSDGFEDELLRMAMLADARAAIATGESSNRTYSSAGGSIDVFIEAVLPPPRLFVFGTGHDAVPVVQLAHNLGWDVCVCTHEVRVATRQRFCLADEILVGSPDELAARINECDRAVAIVMNHNHDLDREQLGMLMSTTARYIGVLGPSARTSRMLDELSLTVDEPRLHAPVGLAIAGETAQDVALAIVSEVQAVLASAPTRPSREIAAVVAPVDIVDVADVEPVSRVSREMAVAVPVA